MMDGFNRRQFLSRTSRATASVVAIAGAVTIVGAERAFALSMKTLDEHGAKTLLRMTRLLYPHDQLGDFYYAKVVADLDGEADKDVGVAQLLKDGIARLDAVHSVKWVDLSEGYQLDALRALETDPFFQKVRGTTVVSLYNNPLLWPVFGYQGSSAEFGGYIHRGFDDLAWGEVPDGEASPPPYAG